MLFVEYSLIGFNTFDNKSLAIFGIVFDIIACIIQFTDSIFLLTVATSTPKKLKYFLVFLIIVPSFIRYILHILDMTT